MRQYYLVVFFSLLLCACVSPPPSKEEFDKQQAAKARVELGIAYLEQRELTLAKQNLDKALAYAPNYYLVHSALAYFYQLQGDNERAENAYLSALKLDGKQGDVLNNYAVFLCKQGRFAQAYQQFQQALNSPNYYQQTDTYENFALCALAEKNSALYQQYRSLVEKLDPQRAQVLPKQIQ
ncbi:type IV pilus biogenesis/stability protein PilW [Avibacterium sp. 21-586]|uniref:type IV pilus biogenesis/stability protein PilW n=1 Tax=Avibacterium sp. 21-586 TaxID=2911534 RepID=UPI0022467D3B|nr:type IV pilus biogenesis/stability protein PilW [Avibacterium sp. 21-586]MCW9710033.1 type IV pilus biogenesis/stability protein PilW [Avibacterium sp. 21-586]